MDTLVKAPNPETRLCWHCHDALADSRIRVQHDQLGVLAFCCQGCLAAFEIIDSNGLLRFYKDRTQPNPRVNQSQAFRFAHYDREDVQARLCERTAADSLQVQLILEGVRCSACVWLLESRLNREPAVSVFSVNPATGHAQLTLNPTRGLLSDALNAINELGYTPHVIGSVDQKIIQKREQKQLLKRLVVAGFGMMQIMMISIGLYLSVGSGMDPVIRDYLRLVCLLVAAPVVFYSGRTFFEGAWLSLKAKHIGMDTSVSLGVLLAFFLSAYNTLTHQGDIYFESALMFIFLLLLSRLIEMSARHQAGSMAAALAALLPSKVNRITAIESDRTLTESVALRELNLNDMVLLQANDLVPADGVVLTGQASVDEAWLTGESLPLDKLPSDSLYSGSLVRSGRLHLKITKLGSDTLLSQVVKLLLRAQSGRPKSIWVADQLARYFVAGVLLASVVVAIGWAYVDPHRLIDALIAVLVISCPCALSLATPVAVAVATQRLARVGVFVNAADALNQLTNIDTVLLDKTGTLTEGKPRVVAIQCFNASITKNEAFAIASGLERGQSHILAHAFNQDSQYYATDVSHVIGQGVMGDVDRGHYRLGRLTFVLEGHATPSTLPMDTYTVYLAKAGKLLAAFSVEDPLRSDSQALIKSLQHLKLRLIILSGDQLAPVRTIAQQLNITEHVSRCTPEDKLMYLHELQRTGARVLAIGDGINDAPLLQAADCSMAIGSGASLAQASAQLVIQSSSLIQIASAVRLSKHMRRLIQQNLSWALLYNFSAIPLAAVGLVPPWLAALGMSLSSLLVVLNALRLKRLRIDS